MIGKSLREIRIKLSLFYIWADTDDGNLRKSLRGKTKTARSIRTGSRFKQGEKLEENNQN